LVILPANASTVKNFSALWLSHKIGHRLPARAEGHHNYHDQQGSKKQGSGFAGCDDYFYGLGLLAKYDKKP